NLEEWFCEAENELKDPEQEGTSGSTIQLKANFFSIISRPQWVLYQYHVDYQPPMESRGLRAALLYPHDKVLGSARSFDGAVLFLPIKLPNTFYNILFRRILRMLNMQQIGPNYYSPSGPLAVPQHRYNNKTYRVDEIAWDHTPNNTFQRGETEVTFKEYVKRQYALEVTDNNPALLVSHVKNMGPAMLIPEFCYLTGLTDKMRSDFTIMTFMKDLGLRTKVDPEQTELQKADWSREMRGLPLISAPPLGNWLLFYTRRNAGDVQHLLESLHKVSGPLGIRMQKAVM
ncbi:hypothetical protein NHX12_024300, partial [Muraenolepis orangiensis]